MKLNRRSLRKLVLETVAEIKKEQRLLREEADPADMDPSRFPLKLSDVVKIKDDAADYAVEGDPAVDGKAGDDEISYTDKDSIASVQKLKPSQSSMNIAKALAFALGHIKSGKPGGHLGAFVSKDGYIMDGHHRWISSGMVNPDSTLGGYLVDFPGKQLVAILNNLTVGKFGHLKGKPAKGGFEQFEEAPIRNQLEDYLANGSGDGEFRLEPEDVQKLIEEFSGETGDAAKDAAVTKFVENLSKLTLTAPEWAPTREDMPIIDQGDSQAALDALSGGEIDINPPYGKVGEKEEVEESARGSRDSLIVERWNRLAGLLK